MDKPASPSTISAGDLEDLLAEVITSRHSTADQHALRAATNLKRAANILNQLELSRLHPSTGRTPAAFRVLFMIWSFQPIEATDIERLSGVSRQSVSGLLATLERDGCIARGRSESDKRQAPITTTAAGAALVEEHLLPQNEVQQDFFGALSADEVETLTKLLARLIVAAHPSK
jgi:DNA-binding MarR family transcriptional regulator